MIAIHIGVDYVGIAALFAPGYSVGNRAIREFRSEANRRGLLVFKNKFLPLRFQQGNTKYKHKQRKVPYTNIKKRLGETGFAYAGGQLIREKVKKKGRINLVRSGISESLAKGPTAIASYPSKATMLIMVKAAVAARPRGDKPNMPNEIRYTTSYERDIMVRTISGVFIRQLRSFNGTVKRKL